MTSQLNCLHKIELLLAPADMTAISLPSPSTYESKSGTAAEAFAASLMISFVCLLQLHEIVQSCQEYAIEAQRTGDQQVQQLFDGLRTEIQHALDKTRRV